MISELTPGTPRDLSREPLRYPGGPVKARNCQKRIDLEILAESQGILNPTC